MQKTAEESADDVDLIMFVIDAHDGLGEKDKALAAKFLSKKIPALIVLTKIDIMPESLLVSELKDLSELGAEVVPVSARKRKNIKELLKVIENLLPEGDKLFEEDIISDRSEKFMIAEIMREKILLKFEKEVPHGVAVIVNNFALRKDGEVYDISLDIICEKSNHKSILIGKQGAAIKETASYARQDMEKFLGKKVFLTTYVKVKEDWRSRPYLLRENGYGIED